MKCLKYEIKEERKTWPFLKCPKVGHAATAVEECTVVCFGNTCIGDITRVPFFFYWNATIFCGTAVACVHEQHAARRVDELADGEFAPCVLAECC